MDTSRRFLWESLRLCGGLIVWGTHLGAVYAWAGLLCARGWADRALFGLPAIPLGVAVATIVAVAVAGLLLAGALRDGRRPAVPGERGFVSGVAAWVAGFALLAIAWTAFVAVMVRPPCSGEPRLSGAGGAKPAGDLSAETAAPDPGQSAPNAIVVSSAFSACRESSRVCCTTIGTSDSKTLA